MILNRTWLKKTLVIVFILIGFMLMSSCISRYFVNEGRKVYVVCDHLHCGVLLTEDLPSGDTRYTHYTFVDEDWYVHGGLDFGGFIDALFLKAPSALEVAVYEGDGSLSEIIDGLNYAVTPDAWRFYIPEDKVQDGLDYIQDLVIGDKGEEITTWNYSTFDYTFYSTEQHYHMFYNCMHFSAYAIDYMGVGIKSGWYLYTNPILRHRLNKLTGMISFD